MLPSAVASVLPRIMLVHFSRGHYTCDLIADDQAWFCDDGVQPTAQDCSSVGHEFASDQVYLIWAVLEPSHIDSVVRAAPRPPLAPGHS